MIEQINWVEVDKRVGRKDTPLGTQWPELDVFGNPYSQPASTIVNDVNPNFFVVIPAREIKPDEWAAIRDSFSTTAPPVPAADLMPEPVETPNDSEPTPVELAAPDAGNQFDPDRAPDAGNVNETPSAAMLRKRSKFE